MRAPSFILVIAAVVVLNLVLVAIPAQAATFDVSQIRLSFLDTGGARVIVISPGTKLKVVANVEFSGSGSFSALWQTSSPEAAAATLFVTRRPERRYLSGGRWTKFISPDLPTRTPGNYQVRFVPTEPDVSFDIPVLHYAVLGLPAEQPRHRARIILTGPQRGVRLDRATTFSWSATPDAHIYQLLFCRPEALRPTEPPASVTTPSDENRDQPSKACSEPLTGVFVRGGATATRLPAHLLNHLEEGKTYHWQITAFRRDGGIVGQSDWRVVYRASQS